MRLYNACLVQWVFLPTVLAHFTRIFISNPVVYYTITIYFNIQREYFTVMLKLQLKKYVLFTCFHYNLVRLVWICLSWSTINVGKLRKNLEMFEPYWLKPFLCTTWVRFIQALLFCTFFYRWGWSIKTPVSAERKSIGLFNSIQSELI